MDLQDVPSLVEQLATGVPDPRQKRGQRYPWRLLLTLMCAALLSGQRSLRGMAHWMALHASELSVILRLTVCRLPSAATLCRVLQTVDEMALERHIAAHGQAVAAADPDSGCVTGPDGQTRCGQAVDGKAVRGAQAHGLKVFLVSLVRHGSGVVLAQQRIAAKTNEITAVPVLLAGRDMHGTVTTVDALLTHASLARQILSQGGDYVMPVKGNQPQLCEAIATVFQSAPLPRGEDDRQTTTQTHLAHGRQETRALTSSEALNAYLDWPGLGQVFQRTCRRVSRRTGEVSEVTVYGLTSLRCSQAPPEQLETFCRGHWTIENRDHYVRDETLGEDRSQVHTGHTAHALAALRNGLLNVLRHQGWHNIAEALRYYAASLPKTLALIGAGAT